MAATFNVGFSLNSTTNAPIDTRAAGLHSEAGNYSTAAASEKRPTAAVYEGLLRYAKQYSRAATAADIGKLDTNGLTITDTNVNTSNIYDGGEFEVYANDSAGNAGWWDAGLYMPGAVQVAPPAEAPGAAGKALSAEDLANGRYDGSGVLQTGFLGVKGVHVFNSEPYKVWSDGVPSYTAGEAFYLAKEMVPRQAIENRIQEVKEEITGLASGARDNLDTLKELGDALSDGTDVAAAVTTQITDMKTFAGSKMQLNNVFTTTRLATATDVTNNATRTATAHDVNAGLTRVADNDDVTAAKTRPATAADVDAGTLGTSGSAVTAVNEPIAVVAGDVIAVVAGDTVLAAVGDHLPANVTLGGTTDLGATSLLGGTSRTIASTDIVDTDSFDKVPKGTTVAELRDHFPTLEALIAAMLELKAAVATFFSGAQANDASIVSSELKRIFTRPADAADVAANEPGAKGSAVTQVGQPIELDDDPATSVLVGSTVTLDLGLEFNRGYYAQLVNTSTGSQTVYPTGAGATSPAYGMLTEIKVTKFAGTEVSVGTQDINALLNDQTIGPHVYDAELVDSHTFNAVEKKNAGKVTAESQQGPNYTNSANSTFYRAAKSWTVVDNTTYKSYAPVFVGFGAGIIVGSSATILSTVFDRTDLRVNSASWNGGGTTMPNQGATGTVDKDTTVVMVHQIEHNGVIAPVANRKSEYVLIPKTKATAPTVKTADKFSDISPGDQNTADGYTPVSSSDYTIDTFSVTVYTGALATPTTSATIDYWRFHFHGSGADPNMWGSIGGTTNDQSIKTFRFEL